MFNFKRKIPNIIKIISYYFSVIIGLLISLLLTIGIIVNFFELPNAATLIGGLGSQVSEKYYYLFGISGLIISIFLIVYISKSLREKTEGVFWRKFFFVFLLALAIGGLLRVGKKIFGF